MNGNEQAIIQFFQKNNNLDLLFISLETEQEVEVYTTTTEKSEQVKFD